MNSIKRYTENMFEDIKHIDENGNEYWLARELQKILEYKDWRNFNKVIEKAIISSNNSFPNQNLWGAEVTTPINSGKGKVELTKDYKLSRYGCYLITQNGDPRKEVISLGQTYLLFKLENKNFLKKSIVCLLRMKKDFTKEV